MKSGIHVCIIICVVLIFADSNMKSGGGALYKQLGLTEQQIKGQSQRQNPENNKSKAGLKCMTFANNKS